jgi:hypothetical protein
VQENQINVGRIVEFARAHLAEGNDQKRCALAVEEFQSFFNANLREVGNLAHDQMEIIFIAPCWALHVEEADAQSLVATKAPERVKRRFTSTRAFE